MLFGAVAAATLIFVLGSDTNVLCPKDLTLALLAGICWKIIIRTFKQMLRNSLLNAELQATVTRADGAVEELKAAAKEDASQLIDQKLVQVGILMESIATQFPSVQDPRLRAAAKKSLSRGLQEINAISCSHPPTSKEAEMLVQAVKFKLPFLSAIAGP